MASPSPKKRARKAKIELYRDLLLNGAERVFAERGYDGTKVQDIADEAGLSLGTLYNVFGAKAEIHRALHEHRLERLLALSRVEVPDAPPIPILLAGVRVYIEFHVEEVNYLRMHLREGNNWTNEETMRHGVEVRAWREGLERIGALLERGQADGTIVEGPTDLLGKMVVATHQVILADWVERGADKAERSLLVQRAHDATLRLLLAPGVTPAEVLS